MLGGCRAFGVATVTKLRWKLRYVMSCKSFARNAFTLHALHPHASVHENSRAAMGDRHMELISQLADDARYYPRSSARRIRIRQIDVPNNRYAWRDVFKLDKKMRGHSCSYLRAKSSRFKFIALSVLVPTNRDFSVTRKFAEHMFALSCYP